MARDGVATSFPQIGLVAASYNRTQWHAIADVISTEGRGKNNALKGNIYQGLTFWAPNVNVRPAHRSAQRAFGAFNLA